MIYFYYFKNIIFIELLLLLIKHYKLIYKIINIALYFSNELK